MATFNLAAPAAVSFRFNIASPSLPNDVHYTAVLMEADGNPKEFFGGFYKSPNNSATYYHATIVLPAGDYTTETDASHSQIYLVGSGGNSPVRRPDAYLIA